MNQPWQGKLTLSQIIKHKKQAVEQLYFGIKVLLTQKPSSGNSLGVIDNMYANCRKINTKNIHIYKHVKGL